MFRLPPKLSAASRHTITRRAGRKADAFSDPRKIAPSRRAPDRCIETPASLTSILDGTKEALDPVIVFPAQEFANESKARGTRHSGMSRRGRPGTHEHRDSRVLPSAVLMASGLTGGAHAPK